MTVAATVLVPTHDHGPTLLRSLPSALAQTVHDIEVLVVGDGAPDFTRELMEELTSADPRVRYFDNPKGPRHGELHRHVALQEARGEIVCYLCDDDLWMPDHVERMRALLDDSDFAYALPFWIDPENRIHCLRVDLGLPYFREMFSGGENRIPLSCGVHTLELYRRLPAGWRTTPDGIFTDLYMWQQILSVPDCRVAGGAEPTVLHFPTPERIGWSSDERLAELDRWAARLGDPGFRDELVERVLAATVADAAALEVQLGVMLAEAAASEAERRRAEARADELDRDLQGIASSATWRLRGRLLAVPGLGASLRAAAKALGDREDHGAAGSARRAPTPPPSGTATGSPAPDPPSDSSARPPDPSTG
jgi:Glycosyl transferase family 2